MEGGLTRRAREQDVEKEPLAVFLQGAGCSGALHESTVLWGPGWLERERHLSVNSAWGHQLWLSRADFGIVSELSSSLRLWHGLWVRGSQKSCAVQVASRTRLGSHPTQVPLLLPGDIVGPN